MRERDNNFYMDYEDTGFGIGPMEQNEALANIINPPAPEKKASNNDAIIESLIKQIQSRSNTSQWSGGYGADAATKDMARILAETGITDISQFGPITQQVEKVVGYEDWGAPIYGTVTEQTFGNKVTGQAVPNTYTERQTGNFFGGTYEGKGNTGYGVQFDDQGLPIFYTQGASSSDFDKFAPLLTLASFVPGLQPFAMAANAAIAAKQGNPLGVITNLAGMGNLAGISGMADVAKAARFASAVKSGDPLAIAFSGANLGGVTNIGGIDLKDISKTIGGIKAIQSGDPLTMMLYGMDAMSKSGGSSSTKSSADLQTEDPLSPEEQAQLIENRLNAAISRSQISPDEEDANTQRAIEDLERMYGQDATNTSTPSTRSLGEPQVEEADDFLKSIGIYTLDKPSDSGLSNQDILDIINADNNRLLITTDKDKPAPAETPAYSPIDDYFKPTPKELEKLEIVGKKEPQYLPTDDDFPATPIKDPDASDLERVLITGKREPQYLPTDDDFMPTPIKDEGELVITTNRDPKYLPTDDDFPATPMPTTPGTTVGPSPTPSVGAPRPSAPSNAPARTPASTASAPSMPFMYQEPANQTIIPELAKVFYFGKNFGGQQQQLSPEGELLTTPYNQLSVTQAGAEPMPQPIPVAQDAKGGENDISALLQQIMSSGDPNMTQEELMQLIQSRG